MSLKPQANCWSTSVQKQRNSRRCGGLHLVRNMIGAFNAQRFTKTHTFMPTNSQRRATHKQKQTTHKAGMTEKDGCRTRELAIGDEVEGRWNEVARSAS